VSAYRKNEKPDVEEVPVREPIRWHRASAPVVLLLWLAFAIATDSGVLEHMPATRVWALLALMLSSGAAAAWNMHRAIDRRDW
jgi:hypothetical protein